MLEQLGCDCHGVKIAETPGGDEREERGKGVNYRFPWSQCIYYLDITQQEEISSVLTLLSSLEDAHVLN